jgi:transcriptional regulator with XRE-family HTH domain
MSIDHTTVSPHDPVHDSIHEATTRLGQRLRRARLTRNLTQGEVAKNQFSVSYVSAVERGLIRPSLGALEKLAERLQVPVTDLLSEAEFTVHYGGISQKLAAQGDHTGARSYAVRSLSAYEAAAVRRLAASAYTQLGTVLHRIGQTSAALAQLTTASTMAVGQRDLRGIAEAQRNLALVYLEEKHSSQAQQAIREALSAAERLGDAALQASAILVLARVQEARKQASEAAESFEHAIELLQSLESTAATAQLREAYAQFSEYLERHGESKRAFEMLKQAYKSTQHA